jgi:glucan phosphorylase
MKAMMNGSLLLGSQAGTNQDLFEVYQKNRKDLEI